MVGTMGNERLDGLTEAPCAGPAGSTSNDKPPKCWNSAAAELVPGSCAEYVPVRMVPTGNLPQTTAGIGLPLKVALTIVKNAVGGVLSIRTSTSWNPGSSVVGIVLGFLAVSLIFHRPSIAAVVCHRPSVLVTRCWGT